MDVYCPKCREPMDLEEFHYIEADPWNDPKDVTRADGHEMLFLTYEEAVRRWRIQGCALFGLADCSPTVDPLMAELYELAGDDMDGLASDMDDLRAIGLI